MYGELLCFLVVSTTESKSRKASAPLSERNVPEFFILILTFLIPLSLALLSGYIFRSLSVHFSLPTSETMISGSMELMAYMNKQSDNLPMAFNRWSFANFLVMNDYIKGFNPLRTSIT